MAAQKGIEKSKLLDHYDA
jgi:hypothetical protein